MLVLYKYVWEFSQQVFQQTDLLDLPILSGCRISRLTLTITLHNFLYTISFDIELLHHWPLESLILRCQDHRHKTPTTLQKEIWNAKLSKVFTIILGQKHSMGSC